MSPSSEREREREAYPWSSTRHAPAGFRVPGFESRVSSPGFGKEGLSGVQGSGVRVQGSGLRVEGSGLRVQGSGFRVEGSGFRVPGSGFQV